MQTTSDFQYDELYDELSEITMTNKSVQQFIDHASYMTANISTRRKQPPAISCANYTRAMMLVFDKFWRGEVSMQQLREQERQLSQQLLIKIEEYYVRQDESKPIWKRLRKETMMPTEITTNDARAILYLVKRGIIKLEVNSAP